MATIELTSTLTGTETNTSEQVIERSKSARRCEIWGGGWANSPDGCFNEAKYTAIYACCLRSSYVCEECKDWMLDLVIDSGHYMQNPEFAKKFYAKNRYSLHLSDCNGCGDTITNIFFNLI